MEDGREPWYHPLEGNEDDAITSDDNRLNQLGYKQELHRGLSAIANFSVTFSVMSVLTGLSTTYSTGLRYGGPASMVYGWPIVGLMTLLVGVSMSEICSAFPTSGGLYFWSAKLSGHRWGPFASWLTGWSMCQAGWSPPPLGMFKLNVDATIKGDKCFISVLTRDSCGTVLEVVTADVCILNVEAAEAKAVSFALEWALKRDWRSIMVESDAQTIVRFLSSSDAPPLGHWESLGYLQKCLSLRACFSSISFVWVPRQVNLAAHHVCRWALSANWVGIVPCLALPTSIQNLLLEESLRGLSVS